MKIYISIYDSINNPYYRGGGAYSTHEIARRLAKNHIVTVVCGAYKNSQDRAIDGVNYKHIGLTFSGPKLSQFIFSLLLPFYAMRSDFDIWLENFQAPHSTGFIPLFTKKPVIAITTTLHAKDFSKKYKLPFHFIENLGIKTYRNFIVMSKNLESRIKQENHHAGTKVIPLGFTNGHSPNEISEKNYVLYLGRLDVYQKGLDLLFEIWQKVCLKNSKIKLLIAGGGSKSNEQEIKKLAAKYGVQNQVAFCGRVDGKLKESLIAQCLMGINSSRFESFGVVALEFMAHEKPFVCFDIDGFKWIPKTRTIKIPPFDTASFAKQVNVLLKSKSLRKSYGQNGKNFARAFDFDVIGKKYESYISKIGRAYGI